MLRWLNAMQAAKGRTSFMMGLMFALSNFVGDGYGGGSRDLHGVEFEDTG